MGDVMAKFLNRSHIDATKIVAALFYLFQELKIARVLHESWWLDLRRLARCFSDLV